MRGHEDRLRFILLSPGKGSLRTVFGREASKRAQSFHSTGSWESLIKFADPVTDSILCEVEVQRKREPLGLKLKCDFGQKLQKAGVGEGVLVQLLGSISHSCKKLLSAGRCLHVCVMWDGCRFSIHGACCEPAEEKGAV